jgi:hypothetical protein
MEDLFTMPGTYLLEALTAHAPSAAALLGISNPSDSIVLVIVLSTFAWVFAVIACWGIVMLARNFYRISEAIIRTLWHRAMQSAGNLRTWTICRYRSLLPKQTASSLEPMAEVQIDDFDFTVLRAAAERGPGFSTSAAELAGKYSLLPSQFQKTLGKLSSNKMLTTVIGSTDGFDNYRITDYGVAYLQMWEQRTAS